MAEAERGEVVGMWKLWRCSGQLMLLYGGKLALLLVLALT